MNECAVCGGELRALTEPREIQLAGRRITVTSEFLRCRNCEETFVSPAQLDAAQKAAAEQIRRGENLLSPREIIQLRAHLGLSQAAFEQFIGVGIKTCGRWERGTVFPHKSTDLLIQMVRDVPGAAEWLAKRRSVQIKPRLAATAVSSSTLDLFWGTPRDTGPHPLPFQASVEYSNCEYVH